MTTVFAFLFGIVVLGGAILTFCGLSYALYLDIKSHFNNKNK